MNALAIRHSETTYLASHDYGPKASSTRAQGLRFKRNNKRNSSSAFKYKIEVVSLISTQIAGPQQPIMVTWIGCSLYFPQQSQIEF